MGVCAVASPQAGELGSDVSRPRAQGLWPCARWRARTRALWLRHRLRLLLLVLLRVGDVRLLLREIDVCALLHDLCHGDRADALVPDEVDRICHLAHGTWTRDAGSAHTCKTRLPSDSCTPYATSGGKRDRGIRRRRRRVDQRARAPPQLSFRRHGDAALLHLRRGGGAEHESRRNACASPMEEELPCCKASAQRSDTAR